MFVFFSVKDRRQDSGTRELTLYSCYKLNCATRGNYMVLSIDFVRGITLSLLLSYHNTDSICFNVL